MTERSATIIEAIVWLAAAIVIGYLVVGVINRTI